MARTVVVTGASSGIGYCTALTLARSGFEVIGTVRDESKGRPLLDAAAAARLPVRTELLDVTDPDSCRTAFERIAARTGGGPWAVVNNAGTALPGAVDDPGEEQIRVLLDTNLLGPARIAAHVLPVMRRRGEGRIVNVSSIAGRVGVPLLGWYSASKHALKALTHALRMENARDGVRVILVEPGIIATPMWETGTRLLDGLDGSHFAAGYRGIALAARLAARFPGPETVAAAIERALRARRPRPRYLVGADAYWSAAAELCVPLRWSDRVKEISVGLRPSPVARLLRQARDCGAGHVSRRGA
ncbi:SDR family NAD(P)-dependent oxidoreductase [Streptomyces sp. NPDC003077]|uniref:SDR family NAD(P)-dependent oxidoreductase n=1 Tax=Streptomyces sp. NPDC003077 TaxID=3154443 RepID=UPI0033A7E5B5